MAGAHAVNGPRGQPGRRRRRAGRFLLALLVVVAVVPVMAGTPAAGAEDASCFGSTTTPSRVERNGVIVGTAGDDVIVGTPGDDRINGRGGDDTLCGAGGNDRINGGGGHDEVDGGTGRDTIDGGGGEDRLSGGPGDDRTRGGRGDDLLRGEAGVDEADGGPGLDTCEAESEVACEADLAARLVVGHTFAIPTTNPAVTTSGATHAYWEAMYNGLIGLDEAGNPVPELAQRVPTAANGGILDGGATYIFFLRDDVYWHDDEPGGVRRKLSATDVKFTFENALLVHHGRTRNMASELASWDPVRQEASIDVLDPLTVRFRFAHPYAPLLAQLNVTEAPILPAHGYSGNPSLQTLNANTVGTGAFRFGGVSGGEARLVRNPRYFGAPRPYVDEIVMRPYPDDGARHAALLNGSVDWVWDVPNQFVASLQANPQFRTASTQSLGGGPNSVDQLVFNLTRSGDRRGQLGGPDPGGTPDPHPILGGFGPESSGAKVRRAIAHAVDRDRYLAEGRFGVGKVATAPISSELAFHAGDVTLPAFDPGQAEALLEEAGWKDEGGAFRVWRGPATPGLVAGQPLVLRFVAPSNIFDSRVVRLDADLAAVGIDLQVSPPGNTTNLVFVNRDFDTSIINYAQGYDPHVGVRRQYHSDQVSTTFGTNAAGYKSSAVDAALDGAARTIDRATRYALYHDFQVQVARDLPYVWLIETPNVRGYTARCSGLEAYTGQFAEGAYCRA